MALRDNMSDQARSNVRTGLWIVGLWAGGKWGGLAGSLIGAKWFGPKPPPAPNPQRDLLLNTTDPTSPIPIVLGSARVSSNYIWEGELEATPIEEGSSGGSGGEKAVVGFKYKMNALDAICEAPNNGIDYGRVWQNGQIQTIRNSSTITPYTGTNTQTVDPLFDSSVDYAVPYHNLAYMIKDSYPLGEQATPPTFFYEVHHYPYNSFAGDNARVYSHVADVSTVGETYGLSVKNYDGTIWMVNDDDELLHYSSDMTTLMDTLDISFFQIDDVYDVAIIERYGNFSLEILHKKSGGGKNYMTVSSVDLSAASGKTTIAPGFIRQVYIWNDDTGDDVLPAKLCYNDDNIFVVYHNNTTPGVAWDIKAVKLTYSLGTVSTTTLVVGAAYIASGADCNNQYLFLHYSTGVGLIKSYDTSTLSLIDTFTMTGLDSDGNNLAVLRGGDELVVCDANTGGAAVMYVMGFDEDGDNIAHRKTIDLTDYMIASGWESSMQEVIPKWNIDGTLLLSVNATSNDYDGVIHIMTSLNPAQAIYYLLVEKARYAESDLSTTMLQDFNDFCFDNQLGLSDVIQRREYAFERVTAYVNMYQCQWMFDSDYKLGIKAFRNSDSSDASITDDDIFGGNSGILRNDGYGEIQIRDDHNIPSDLRITFTNRLQDYNEQAFTMPHFLAQQNDNRRLTDDLSYFCVPQDAMASKLAQRASTWAHFKTQVYRLPLVQKHDVRSVGDLITVTSSNLDLSSQLMRILDIDAPTLEGAGEPVNVICAVEDLNTNTFYDYVIQKNNAVRLTAKPPVSVLPFAFEQDAAQNNDMYTLAIGALNYSDDTIGAQLWISIGSQSNYNRWKSNDITSFGIAGDIVTAIDEDDNEITVNTGAYPNTFPSRTISEQVDNLSFCLIGTAQSTDAELLELEMVSYRDVEDSGANKKLRNCFRGRYYTVRKAHGTDEVLILCGLSRFQAIQIPEQYVGQTIYIKLLAYNKKGETENLSDVTAYEYTIGGWTRKATKVSTLELYDKALSEGLGSKVVIETNEATLQYLESNRAGGPGITTAGQYREYTEPPLNENRAWDLLIYDSSKVYVTIRADIQDDVEYTADADGVHHRFDYTAAYNAADFGVLTKDFYVAIAPKNAKGDVRDVGGTRNNLELKHVILNT